MRDGKFDCPELLRIRINGSHCAEETVVSCNIRFEKMQFPDSRPRNIQNRYSIARAMPQRCGRRRSLTGTRYLSVVIPEIE